MRFKYTPEMLAFLQEGFKTMRVPALTIEFNKKFKLNKTQVQIHATLKNHSFRCGRPAGFAKGERSIFTPEQVAWLTDQYKVMARREITREFNNKYGTSFSVSAMTSSLKRYGIKSGRDGQFKKGNVPWTVGAKGKGIIKPNSGCFKKGIIPANLKPLGHERIDTQNGYILVKVAEPNPYTGAPTRYREKHQVVWEQHHGQIPSGHIITFIDGDPLNPDINNLECISKAENVRRNKLQYRKQPPELQPVVRTLAKVITRAHQLEKDHDNAIQTQKPQ
jgi:hypothetical protein